MPRRPRPPSRPAPTARRPPPPFPRLPDVLAGARRIAVVGVGSDLRGDDVAGVLVARRLASWAARTGCDRLLAIAGGAAPENFTGEIVRFRPDLVVLVDAAHLGLEPGAVEAIPPERIGGLSFSTHMLPAPIFLDYLVKMTGCRTAVLGIDLAGKEVLARVSAPVERAVRRIVAGVRRVMEGARASVRPGSSKGKAAQPTLRAGSRVNAPSRRPLR